MSIVQYTEQEQRLTNTLRMTTEALKQVTAERDALRADAERYQALRHMAVKLSLSNDTIAMLVKDQTELDGAIHS